LFRIPHTFSTSDSYRLTSSETYIVELYTIEATGRALGISQSDLGTGLRTREHMSWLGASGFYPPSVQPPPPPHGDLGPGRGTGGRAYGMNGD